MAEGAEVVCFLDQRLRVLVTSFASTYSLFLSAPSGFGLRALLSRVKPTPQCPGNAPSQARDEILPFKDVFDISSRRIMCIERGV